MPYRISMPGFVTFLSAHMPSSMGCPAFTVYGCMALPVRHKGYILYDLMWLIPISIAVHFSAWNCACGFIGFCTSWQSAMKGIKGEIGENLWTITQRRKGKTNRSLVGIMDVLFCGGAHVLFNSNLLYCLRNRSFIGYLSIASKCCWLS